MHQYGARILLTLWHKNGYYSLNFVLPTPALLLFSGSIKFLFSSSLATPSRERPKHTFDTYILTKNSANLLRVYFSFGLSSLSDQVHSGQDVLSCISACDHSSGFCPL